MKKYKIILLAVAVAVISFAVVFALTPRAKNKPVASGIDVTINLQADKAVPDQAIVKVGQTVQFNSKDGKSHSLTLGEAHDHEGTAGTYNSGEFKADEAWKVTFKEAGTFRFYDEKNPNITIIIVAYNP